MDPYYAKRIKALRARQSRLARSATRGLPIDGDPLETRRPTETVAGLMDKALEEITAVRNPFFDAVCAQWDALFPGNPARPIKWADGILFLRVSSAPQLFMLRPKIPAMKRKLRTIPGAPKRLVVNFEIVSNVPSRSGR